MQAASLLTSAILFLLTASLALAEPAKFVFRDVAEEAGILPAAAGIHGHTAGWGDADGDGWLDLYVGTFYEGGKANLFFRNVQGKFQLDEQPSLAIHGRCNSSLFADFDNDGDLDLYVSSMPKPARELAGCRLFRNDGGGKFSDISKENGACPNEFGGRSAAAFDFDGDGLLDLLVGEDPIPGYNGSKTTSSRIFRNAGELKFEDVSARAGLPAGVPGLGVAAGDVNGDSWPDFFLASKSGGNRLFLNDGQGRFAEAAGTRELFDWSKLEPAPKGDDTPCGVALGDVNRDGRLDLVIGNHYQAPWRSPVCNRLYLNRGVVDGELRWNDITDAAGLTPLPMKGPHLELQDFDNDGWPDLYVSLVKFSDGAPHPLIFRHLGLQDDLPRFTEQTLAVNDFPTAADIAVKGTGAFFEKMLQDRKIIYMAPGPAGDFDNDGRLDLFLASWWLESPSLLLRNETKAGHWLKIAVTGAGGVNRQGIGSAVRIYRAGQAKDPKALLGYHEITVTQGYASNQEAIAHFGLGEATMVDVVVTLPHGQGEIVRRDVRSDQRVIVPAGE